MGREPEKPPTPGEMREAFDDWLWAAALRGEMAPTESGLSPAMPDALRNVAEEISSMTGPPSRVGGEFWMPDNPKFRVRGVFSADVRREPEVSLESNLVNDPRVSVHIDPDGRVRGVAVSANATRHVASLQATTLHGQLDTGEPVTLIDAHNHGRAGDFGPRYRTGAGAVVAAHVSKDQLYRSVRFRMDRPYSLEHLADGESSELEDDGSRLAIEASGGGRWRSDKWLVYDSANGDTLRQLEVRVVSRCLALLQLAMYPDEDRKTRETQVRIQADGRWELPKSSKP